MSYFRFFMVLLVLSFSSFGTARADVWKWVDASGDSHYVDTETSIFTWVDDGRVFYSDTPDHEDAVAVQLVWVSKGTLEDARSADASDDGFAFPGETPAERAAREEEQAHYCKKATEIYDSYKNAPRLYRTNEDGEKEYLSKRDAKTTLAETKAKKDELCK
jgi:hypothetical protein